MKIVVFEVEPWEREAFEPLQAHHDVVFEESPLTQDRADARGDAEVISTFIYSDLSARVLERFAELKIIATRSTGFDHIDADHCRERGIRVLATTRGNMEGFCEGRPRNVVVNPTP